MPRKPSKSGVVQALGAVAIDLHVADDLRVEADGKVTAVGLYPDRVVVLLVPADAPPPNKAIPFAFDSVALLINVRNLGGNHEISIRLGNEDDPADFSAVMTRKQVVNFADPARSINLVCKFRPFPVASFGHKVVTVTIDGTDYELPFEVRRGDAPGVAAEGFVPVTPFGVPKPVAAKPARAKTIKTKAQ